MSRDIPLRIAPGRPPETYSEYARSGPYLSPVGAMLGGKAIRQVGVRLQSGWIELLEQSSALGREHGFLSPTIDWIADQRNQPCTFQALHNIECIRPVTSRGA
jgi:hypothetical protein